MNDDPRLPGIEKQVERAIATGNDIRSIRDEFLGLYDSEKLVDKAISNVRNRINHIYDLEDPYVISSESKREMGAHWYAGPSSTSTRWNFVKERLAMEGRSEKEIAEVLNSSETILGLLDSPGSPVPFASRGLVLGYVQSGKTTNFISTIAQAADAGYRLIIVLSGVTNNLRKQTQDRLERSLTGNNPNNWNWLTSLDSDFNESRNANDLLSAPSKRVIAVIKKNNSRLKKLKSWLNDASTLTKQGLPVLIIDDEADQATVNSAKAINRQTAINKTLTEILDIGFLPKNAYLGYTATPFANILSDARTEKQLFPRDFIYPLNRPDHYFGAEQLFGRNPIDEEDQEVFTGRDIVIPITIADKIMLGPLANMKTGKNIPELPDSLLRAMKWFILATAVRKWRTGRNRFSTMLIHTSGYIAVHEEMAMLLSSQLATWRRLPKQQIESLLRDIWDFEKLRGWRDTDGILPEFEEFGDLSIDVLNQLKLIVDNSRSEDRLSYDFTKEFESVPYIVVGGNTLARGLTLEGLSCSYFMRTSSYYDSLLQMGRWFGYRMGYEDLQRIWMQEDLIPMFRDLALIEEEVRIQITELAQEGLQPIQIPIKIRDHPIMSITAPNKMNYAKIIQSGYSKKRTETITFSEDSEWLETNISATKTFISQLASENLISPEPSPQGYATAYEVPWSTIRKYISQYQFLPTARIANGELISKYIDLHQGKGELEYWNVFFYKTLSSDLDPVDLGSGISISPINRSAKDIDSENKIVNIHHLVSSIDGAADVPLTRSQFNSNYPPKLSDTDVRNIRKEHGLAKIGLLGIYLVNGLSEAKTSDRQDLNLARNIVGLGFFFPESSLTLGVLDYYGPDLPDENEFEDDYLEAADIQDEAH